MTVRCQLRLTWLACVLCVVAFASNYYRVLRCKPYLLALPGFPCCWSRSVLRCYSTMKLMALLKLKQYFKRWYYRKSRIKRSKSTYQEFAPLPIEGLWYRASTSNSVLSNWKWWSSSSSLSALECDSGPFGDWTMTLAHRRLVAGRIDIIQWEAHGNARGLITSQGIKHQGLMEKTICGLELNKAWEARSPDIT